jgi:cell division protein FtsQ
MAEKPEKSKRAPEAPPLSHLIGRIALVCGVVVGLGVLFLAEVQAESFLKRDPRFFLERSPDYNEPPPNLQIDGLVHASREDIVRVFEPDLGRSILLIDLEKRRLALLGIPWIADASVSRLWPDRVSVRLTERKPIAFVKQPSAQVHLLIDSEGFLMPAPANANFALPVVSGVEPSVNESLRKERMARVSKLIRELDGRMSDISEIDAHDVQNLLLFRPLKGRAVTLKMGSKNFGFRYANFLSLADELLTRLPNGVIFDLRLEEQVVVAEDPNSAPQPVAPAPAPVPAQPKEELKTNPKPKPASKKADKRRKKNGD